MMLSPRAKRAIKRKAGIVNPQLISVSRNGIRVMTGTDIHGNEYQGAWKIGESVLLIRWEKISDWLADLPV